MKAPDETGAKRDTEARLRKRRAVLRIDRTHLSRRASGIERITRELFSDDALAPLPVEGFDSSPHRLAMAFRQAVVAPASALMDPRTLWVFSGYPPSIPFTFLPERTVHYVHDLFMVTRSEAEFNLSARLYMSPNFRMAVRHLRYFLVNSLTTGRALAEFTRADAEIRPFRPVVRNVFGLAPRHSGDAGGPLVVGSVGTVEPRKNFVASARICAALAALTGRAVEFHVVGRRGWGPDHGVLAEMPHVHLHGFLAEAEARAIIERFDLFLATSRDEGLGLPLLEVQHGGLPVVAPDLPVFRETLAESGVFIDAEAPEAAARRIRDLVSGENWRAEAAGAALANVARWNAAAWRDRDDVHAFLAERLAVLDSEPAHPGRLSLRTAPGEPDRAD